jgi:homoserine kinase
VSLCPWCGEALAAVREAGAEHTLVSGSGPTIVGIWWGSGAIERASEAADPLVRSYPRAVVAEPVTAESAAPSLI